MRRRLLVLSLISASAMLLVAPASSAQEPAPEPAPPAPQSPPPPEPPVYQQPPIYYPPPQPYRPVPARELEAHAPKYSLWTGARISYVGFGLSFYGNEREQAETTGNFLGNGIAPALDLGARISYRYVPYVFWEHGFMGQGHRFANSNATSSTDFYGIGIRYVSGDVDSVSFLTDLSIGKRIVGVSNGSQTYEMNGVEFLRLGLGAEIRVATLLSLSPLVSISGGRLNDSEGDISFGCAPSCPDGINGPTFAKSTRGNIIQEPHAYVVVSAGLGIHFDLFGK